MKKARRKPIFRARWGRFPTPELLATYRNCETWEERARILADWSGEYDVVSVSERAPHNHVADAVFRCRGCGEEHPYRTPWGSINYVHKDGSFFFPHLCRNKRCEARITTLFAERKRCASCGYEFRHLAKRLGRPVEPYDECSKCKRPVSLEGMGGFNPNRPGIVYYLRIERGGLAPLYKIGITNLTVAERYGPRNMAVITILKTWPYNDGAEAMEHETRVLREHKRDRYNGPAVLDDVGIAEIFARDVLALDMEKVPAAA